MTRKELFQRKLEGEPIWIDTNLKLRGVDLSDRLNAAAKAQETLPTFIYLHPHVWDSIRTPRHDQMRYTITPTGEVGYQWGNALVCPIPPE